jgi:hypothetical protein
MPAVECICGVTGKRKVGNTATVQAKGRACENASAAFAVSMKKVF